MAAVAAGDEAELRVGRHRYLEQYPGRVTARKRAAARRYALCETGGSGGQKHDLRRAVHDGGKVRRRQPFPSTCRHDDHYLVGSEQEVSQSMTGIAGQSAFAPESFT